MKLIVNQSVSTAEGRLIHPSLLPEEVDGLISNEIETLTAANNTFWSSPDHDRNEYLHSFFQYPAMMVPVVQRKLIEIITHNNPSIANMLDPFMGSGTSLVACMENGLDCYGQDINPLAILVSKTRTGPYYVQAIQNRKTELFERIEKDRSKKIEADFKGLDKWFNPEVAIELSKIVRAIRLENTLSIKRFYWVILAEVVRINSNDRTSTFKLHIRTQEDRDNRDESSIKLFKKHFESCMEDLSWYATLLDKANMLSKGAYIGDVKLSLADSKTSVYTPFSEAGFFDLLVTSPPYGDNKTTVTYGQHSYLPLQWIDLEDIHELATYDFLKTTCEIDSRALGGKLQKLDEEKLEILFANSESFRNIYLSLSTTAPKMLSKVVSFIYDLYLSIVNIHASLKVNAYQIWTIGNRNVGGLEVPNCHIIEELICNQGAILVARIEREILNKRMAYRNKDSELMNYEDILIFRKIG